jgi:hypothetical protein
MLPLLSLQDYGIQQTPADLVAEIRVLSADDGRAGADGQTNLKDWARRNVGGMKRLVADVESRGAENVGELIASLERFEGELKGQVAEAKELLAEIETTRRQVVKLSSSTPEVIRELTELARRARVAIEAGNDVVRAYQDGRWQLMAIRAEAEGEGDSPVFDDVDQLMKHVLA